MKKMFSIIVPLFLLSSVIFAQKEKPEGKEKVNVPPVVKSALTKKYPNASKVTWEKENRNYEANWGGKSGEDNSVQFTPKGDFIEIVNAIPTSKLPSLVMIYVKQHYKDGKITEAGRVTDANGKITYEVEINRKDVIFDKNGNFIKTEK